MANPTTLAAQQTPRWELVTGDCVRAMRDMAAKGTRFHAVVTDPPYHLTDARKRFVSTNARHPKPAKGYMGNEWDGDEVAFDPETWKACLDLLPPGGHVLAFGGSRTYHRLACAVEDAGFEIRDQLLWLHGSGMAKSRDVARDIERLGGVEGVAVRKQVAELIVASGMSDTQVGRLVGKSNNTVKFWRQGIRNIKPEDVVRLFEALGVDPPNLDFGDAGPDDWNGWGTALKPAFEPIVLARKPLGGGDVARAVLAHGTGAINVDACRVGDRWPANVAHDGEQETIAGMPDGACRYFYCAKASTAERRGSEHPTVKPLALMRWLVRLVCPPGGTVLDPFAGTGTTGEAAVLEGFRCVMVEREAEHFTDIEQRMALVTVD